MPLNGSSRYVGIERLVWEYANELVKQNQEVAVIGHEKSIFPSGVILFPVSPLPDSVKSETKAFQKWQYILRNYDVIQDFSHLHLASTIIPNLPSLNLIWHSPCLIQYPKAPYNIIAPSEWATRDYQRYYHQKARYQQSIGINTDVYKPLGKRGDRFLTIGRMAEEKGNLRAIILCKKAGVPLDVAGGRGVENEGQPLTLYEQVIMNECDGEQIRFLGEVTEDGKIDLMRRCKALIYATNYPEPTNHKLQECLLCGAPAIVPRLGAIPEIVTEGVDAFVCQTDEEYIEAIKAVDVLQPEFTRESLVRKYDIRNVVKDFLPLYQEVKEGLRWR